MTSTPFDRVPPEANAFPFAELLAELRRGGFGIGLHDYKDVAKLASRWQGIDRDVFRNAMAALLARSPDEVVRIREAFDEWFDAERTAPPPPPPVAQPRVRTWHVAVAVLLLTIGAAGGAWWYFAHQHIGKPTVVRDPGNPPPPPPPGDDAPTTPPPALPEPPRKPARERPWLAAAAVAVAALVALAVRGARAKQKGWARKYWRHVLAHEPGPHHYEPRVGRTAPSLPPAVIEEVATILGRARETDPVDGDVLDVEESLRLTLRYGMAPHLRFAPPPRNVPVVVLQDVGWQMRPWAAKVDAFAASLRRRGVLVERWFFDGDPLQVSRAPHGRTIALESLSLSRAEASVMLLSGGQGIGAPSLRELGRLLKRWRFRTWLHPVGNPRYWRRELASLPVRIWPMTPAGVRAAAVEISRKGDMGVAPKLAAPRSVTPGDVERMRELLALAPTPTLELAEELRRRFAPEVPEEVILFLGAEGVFYGETIAIPPEQLQRLLAAAALDPVRERDVRRYLLEMLRESRPPEESAALLRWQLDDAVQRLRIDPADASARDTVQSLANGPLRDEVHEAVATHGLGVAVKDRPVTELPKTPPRFLGKRPPLWAWPRLATAAVALLVLVPLTLLVGRVAATGAGDPIPHREGVLPLTLDPNGNLAVGVPAPGIAITAILYRGEQRLFQVNLTVARTLPVPVTERNAWFQLRHQYSQGNLATSDPVWVPARKAEMAAPPWIEDDIGQRVMQVVARFDNAAGNAPPLSPQTRLADVVNGDGEGAMGRLMNAIATEFNIVAPAASVDTLPTVSHLAAYVRQVMAAKPAMGTLILRFTSPGGRNVALNYQLKGVAQYTGAAGRPLNVEPGTYAVSTATELLGGVSVTAGSTVQQVFKLSSYWPGDDVARRVVKIIARFARVDESRIRPETLRKELAPDNWDAAAFVAAMEKEFGIPFDNSPLNRMETVQEIIDYVKKPPRVPIPRLVSVTLNFTGGKLRRGVGYILEGEGRTFKGVDGEAIRVPPGSYTLTLIDADAFAAKLIVPPGGSYTQNITLPEPEVVPDTLAQTTTTAVDMAAIIEAEAVKNIDWSIGNTGAPDCADEYVKTGHEICLSSGNRACVMRGAIAAVQDPERCHAAFEAVLMTQCHNAPAQESIRRWGQTNVCNYLKSKGKTGQ